MFGLAARGFLGKRFESDIPLTVALKSDTNIWSYHSTPGTKYSIEKAFEGLSFEEIEGINSLRYVTA